MDNPQELKKAILAVLAEKGDYSTLLKHLDTDEKKEKEEKMYKLIEPISAFADLLTQNNEGAFMEKLTARMDGTTKEAIDSLTKDISNLREELKEATSSLLDTTKSDLVAEHLSRYEQAESSLSEKMMQLAVEIVTSKADELLPSLYEGARLTEDEIEDIIEASALSVESQLSTIISEYIKETKITPSQIVGFAEAVRNLLPENRQVSWSEIVGKPEISPGGTSAILVKRMIDDALASFTGSGHAIRDEGVLLTQRANLNFTGAGVTVTDDAGNNATVITIPGGGGGGITDGDKGDITVTGAGAVWTIDNDVVSNDKAANMATKTYKGRTSAATGDPEDVPVATLKADLVLVRADVGLGNVDNTSDVNKPVSTAQQTALNLKQDLSGKDVALGYAGLDASGRINPSQLPALAVTDTFVVASQAAQVALTAEVGDVAVRTDQNRSYILRAAPASTFSNWQELLTPTDTVQSVFSRTGVVTAQAGDYTAIQIINAPAGSIGATTVQGALNELDIEKSAVGHTHILSNVTDVTITAANLNSLDDGADTTLHFHASDRARANHTGSQLAATISDFATAVKRVPRRTSTITSSATPAINTDDVDELYITAQAVAITSFSSGLTGTPTEGQLLFIAITGTAARAITWGASFENGPVALPLTTVTTARLDVLLKWNTVTSRWRCMASGSTV